MIKMFKKQNTIYDIRYTIYASRFTLHTSRVTGFTLMEALIGIAFLGFFLVTAIAMFDTVLKVSGSGEDMAMALNLAQEKMEQIKFLAREGNDVAIGTGSNTGDSFLPDLTDVNADSFLLGEIYASESDTYRAGSSLSSISPRTDRITQVTWVEGVDTYKKVQVTVFWSAGSKTHSLGIVSYIRE